MILQNGVEISYISPIGTHWAQKYKDGLNLWVLPNKELLWLWCAIHGGSKNIDGRYGDVGNWCSGEMWTVTLSKFGQES